MIRERRENPVIGDTINLRVFTYSSNSRADIYQMDSVNIYYLDKEQATEANPEGRVHITSIPANQIFHPSQGEYQVVLKTNPVDYRVGTYIDRWEGLFEIDDSRPGVIENYFNIYRDLWYTSPIPLVYEIGFVYSPTKILSGSKKYIRTDIEIYTRDKSIVEQYYYYLRGLQSIQFRLTLDEGPDYDPVVSENNIIQDWAPMSFAEDRTAYFLLDTSIDPRPSRSGRPLPLGIYLIQFKAALGETVHLSPKFRLQIYN